MKLFNFGNQEREERPVNFNNVMMIRVLAVGYILYMLYDTITMYIKGGEDAPSLAVLLVCILVLGGGSVGIGLITFNQWKKHKAQQQLEAEEGERLAEEAAALEAENEDLEAENEEVPEETEETE